MSMKAEALQSVITWIPVSERRLPVADMPVLVCTTHGTIEKAVWILDVREVNGGFWSEWNRLSGLSVTHWAELPEPPTERTARS